VDERASRDAEQLGGPGLVAARLLERLEDAAALDRLDFAARRLAQALRLTRLGGRARHALGRRRGGAPAGGGRRHEVRAFDRTLVTEERGPFTRAPQLAHVAWPLLAARPGDGVGVEPQIGAPERAACLGDEARRQRGNLVAPLAQRRDVERGAGQPVVEIAAETAGLDLFL